MRDEDGLEAEEIKMRTQFRKFAETEVRPLAQEIDEAERFPEETIYKLKEKGYLGLLVSKELGGMGCNMLQEALLIEELSRICAATGVIVSTHTLLCCEPVRRFGTEEQKKRYLVPLAKGESLGAFALTERNAGTDAGGIETTAVLQGDHYVLNGSKMFITNAGRADVYVIFASTDLSKGTKGMSAFIVEKGFPGFEVGKIFSKMGIRGSLSGELILEDCAVPKANLLGEEGAGFKIALCTLDGGRIGIAAQALGIAEGAFEETVKYVRQRKQFGKPLSAFQNTQFKLADMKTKIEAARLLICRAARTKDKEQDYAAQAAMAKLFASETAMDVTTGCVQMFGGYGYMKDCPVERMMRDAKITEIYEGTSEVQRMVVFSSILNE